MLRTVKYLVGAGAVAGWLAFALSPKGETAPRDAGPASLDHGSLDPVPLRGEVLADDDALGLPSGAALVGGHVVLVDRAGAGAFHAVDRATGRLASFGSEGEGPGEFEAPWSLDPVPGRPAFWAWDIRVQRLTLVELAGGAPSLPLRSSPIVRLRSSAAVTGVVAAGEGRWLGLGLFTDGRLGEFDREGRLVGTRGSVPGAGQGLPPGVLQQAYTGTMAARPDRRRVAVGARNAGRLEIHDVAGGPGKLAAVPFPFEPRFSVRETPGGLAMASGRDLRFGYIHVAAAPAHVYGLFSGRTVAGHPERAHYAGHVHVFDWEGAFVGALRLDADAVSLAVDEEEGILYAVGHHPVPALRRYELPAPAP